MAPGISRRPITVYGAIASNLLIAGAKFTAALMTGSSAMLAEGIHSTVDTGNELLLLLGLRRSARPGDELHLRHPTEIRDPLWSYMVLGVALVVEGTSWLIALRELLRRRRGGGLWRAVRASKDPSACWWARAPTARWSAASPRSLRAIRASSGSAAS